MKGSDLMEKPILAQYTIRSKQSYIFRTDKSDRLLEIMGASEIIDRSFDFIFDCAEQCGFRALRVRSKSGWGEPFNIKDVVAQFALADNDSPGKHESGLDVVELFIGGGNDTILFRNMDVCRHVNEQYSRLLLTQYPGVIPMYVGVPVDLSPHSDYNRDYGRLMDEVDREKNRMIPGRGGYAVPFAMMNRNTFQPFSQILDVNGDQIEVTDESKAKYIVGQKKREELQQTRFLDDMITKHGEESLLAVVHADGNNMGLKIKRFLNGKESYDECVTMMRKFSWSIDKAFEAGAAEMEKRRKKMEEDDRRDFKSRHSSMKKDALNEALARRTSTFFVRWVISGGDDATFLCNARYAKDLTAAYLDGVYKYQSSFKDLQLGKFSSCAGICIFHSHDPIARAYALAEEACSNAKVRSRAADKRGEIDECWVDFHVIQSGTGGNLKELRSLHQTADKQARPWLVVPKSDKTAFRYSLDALDQLAAVLRKFNISRTNIKTFGAAYEIDPSQGKMEWDRICYHTDDVEEQQKGNTQKKTVSLRDKLLGLEGNTSLFPNHDALLKALYDISEVYDLWYAKRGD